MKKVFYFVSLACMMMFAACSSENDEFVEESQNGEMMTVGVGMPGADETRVDFVNNELTNMVWAKGDKLMAIGYKTSGYPGGESNNFNLVSGEGTVNAKFQGTKVSYPVSGGAYEDASKYRMVYKGSNVAYTRGNKNWHEGNYDCKYDAQKQTTTSGFNHIKDHLLMYSDIIEASTGSGITKGGNLAIKNSILKINMTSLPAGFDVDGTYNVSFFVNYAEGSKANAVLEYTGVITAGNYLYMAFDPVVMAKDNVIRFEITNGSKTFYASNKARKDINYTAGKIYNVNIDNAWTWTEVAAAQEETVYYEVGFNTPKDPEKGKWKNEIGNGIFDYGNGLTFSAWGDDTKMGNSEIRFSPEMTLNSAAKYIYFNNCYYNTWKTTQATEAFMKSQCELVIRQVGGEWKSLPFTPYVFTTVRNEITPAWSKAEIPAEFIGKNVQIGFKFTVKNELYFSWNVQDMKVTNI